MTYAEAKRRARAAANETGFDHGLTRSAFGWSFMMLPRRENRFGHELRCEVVSCDDLARCRPGHGPGGGPS